MYSKQLTYFVLFQSGLRFNKNSIDKKGEKIKQDFVK